MGRRSGGGNSGPGSGTRDLKVRVKTARRRKTSSTRWLARQLNDPYVAEARRQGFRSRAAFKLAEIDDRYGILHGGQRIVDLGCAPGGWGQVAAQRAKSTAGDGKVVGVDLQAVEPIPGVELITKDFLDDDAPDVIRAAFGGSAVDVVLSDMAAPASGHKQTDHIKIMALCEAAADFASSVLEHGGTFCAKVLRGGTENELLIALKRDYETVRHVKPAASRSDSAEAYVLATGFRGRQNDEA